MSRSSNEFMRDQRGQSSNYNDPSPAPPRQAWEGFDARAEDAQNERDAQAYERMLQGQAQAIDAVQKVL